MQSILVKQHVLEALSNHEDVMKKELGHFKKRKGQSDDSYESSEESEDESDDGLEV